MNITKKIRNLPGPPVSPRIYTPGEQPPLALTGRHDAFFGLQIAQVVSVDTDNYRANLEWVFPNTGARQNVLIAFPGLIGPRGCLGALPEINSLVLVGFIASGSGGVDPVIIGYLPYQKDLATQFAAQKLRPDFVSPPDVVPNITYFKHRQLRNGDVIMSSPLGAEIFINRDLQLKTASQNEIKFRDADQSFIVTSINNFLFADGVSVSSGQIIRPGANLNLNNIRERVLEDGSKVRLIVPFIKNETNYKNESEYDQLIIPYYTEYRVSVDEQGTNSLDHNEINSGASASNRRPAITLVMGNYVGAIQNDLTYGKVLKAKMFSSRTDIDGTFELIEALQNQGIDEIDSQALIYALHSHKAGHFIGIDKEGHYYQVLPASSNRNKLGAGRSMSILAYGNKKEVWGSDDDGNAWDLTAQGGVNWILGSYDPSVQNGRSLNITTDRGISITVNNPDELGFSKYEELNGDAFETVSGNKTIIVEKDLTIECQGLRTDRFLGAYQEHYAADKSLEVNGTFSELIMKDKQTTCLTRSTTILNPPISPQGPMKIVADEKIVNFGDITEQIRFFGNKKTTLTLGNIEETIVTGSRRTTVGAGAYDLSVGAGVINIKTAAGAVTITGTSISVTGQVAVNVTAPIVSVNSALTKLGNGAIPGVITFASHQDYITGLPLRPSVKVWSA